MMQPFWDEFIRLSEDFQTRMRLLQLWAATVLDVRRIEEVTLIRRVYGREWRRWLREDSVCGACFVGRNEEAHHVIPLAQGGPLVHENLFPICRSCHRVVHVGRAFRCHRAELSW